MDKTHQGRVQKLNVKLVVGKSENLTPGLFRGASELLTEKKTPGDVQVVAVEERWFSAVRRRKQKKKKG